MWRVRREPPVIAEPASRHVPRGVVDLRVVTYNVHRCRGMDRRVQPERIAAVLASIEPDIVALQEVVGPGITAPGHAETLGAALAMGWVMAPARELRRHQFGNVVMSRYPIREHTQHDLTWKTCEARSAQRVAIDVEGIGTIQIYNVHLGTALLERRYQAARLATWVHDRRVAGPKLVLGDFNEWSRGLVADVLAERLESVDLYPHLKRRRTYPGFFPLFHLDHIYFQGQIEVRHIDLPRTRLALVASDHLPLVADIRVRF
jgi:endonuclease/exonuclease/phosphatase family metal-dependent hydrolase